MIGRFRSLAFTLALVGTLTSPLSAQQIEIRRTEDRESTDQAADDASNNAVEIGPSEEERERARGLFGEAVEHAQNEEWEFARDKFRDAYAIIPNETILVNLAGAQIETGRYVEGVASYRRFLETVHDGPLARLRRSAEQTIEEYEAKIANVTINLTNVAAGDVLRVGDQEMPASASQELPLNPGDHRLDIQRDGASAAFSEISLTEGETRVVDIELPEHQVVVPTPEEAANQQFIEINSRRDDEERTSDGGAPVGLIIGISAGVLVAAGAVVAILLLTKDSGGTEPPFQDGNWGVLEVP